MENKGPLGVDPNFFFETRSLDNSIYQTNCLFEDSPVSDFNFAVGIIDTRCWLQRLKFRSSHLHAKYFAH